MNLTVVSHPCATPTNQHFFAVVEEVTGWNITIISPSNWLDDYGKQRDLERWPRFEGRLKAVPVYLSGNIPLHVYKSRLTHILSAASPHAIFVHHEPYAAATAQVYLANATSTKAPIGFFTWQNILKSYPPPFRWTESWVYRNSDFAFPGSQSAELVLRRKGYEGPTTLLPGSIDPSIYYPVSGTDDLFPDWKQPEDQVIIGYMGRVAREKGLGTLLEALRRLPDELQWRLIVVGEGDYAHEFDQQAEQVGISSQIIRTGYVPHPDAPKYLSAFDVLVLPSETQPNWKEQFGRVLIEAMACGTAVVGSDSGEIPNVIDDTEGGLVFEEGNPEELRRTLQKLIQDAALRNSLSERGRETVRANYSHESLARRFARTIRAHV